MEPQSDPYVIDQPTAEQLSAAAGNAFQPRTPISAREFFAGRWEQLTTVADSVAQAGLHIVIFGERGVGKTSLANVVSPLLTVMEESLTQKPAIPRLVVKVNTHHGDSFSAVWRRVFDEVSWFENKPMIGLVPQQTTNHVSLRTAFKISDTPTIDEVRRALGAIPRSVFIFDEFDRGSNPLRLAFTDLIKALSDYAVNSTIVIVGVAETIDGLVKDHASIIRSIVQIHLPRMTEKELTDIIEKASKVLGIEFSPEASKLVVKVSQGLPHYTHLIGLHSAREALKRFTKKIEVSDVHRAFPKAIQQAIQSIQEIYSRAIQSAHKDALYEKVILACAAASSDAMDTFGYFRPADIVKPLAVVLNRPNVKIGTFRDHINEFCEEARGSVLEREGKPRSYKYRFKEPLLPPFIFMNAAANNSVDMDRLKMLTACA